jgi:alpha-mannosidase
MMEAVNNKWFFTVEKIKARREELERYRLRRTTDIDTFQIREADSDTHTLPEDETGWRTEHIGTHWKGRDTYLWLKLSIDIPGDWAGETPVLVLDLGNTSNWTNDGFEALLYLDGKPYKGVDQNHKLVFLPETMTGTKTTIYLRLWSGLEGGGKPQEQEHKFGQIKVAILDRSVDELLFLTDACIGAYEAANDEREKAKLLSTVNAAYATIDWSEETYDDDTFRETVHKAYLHLTSALAKMPRTTEAKISAIGHTHIDLAWLWRLKHTREKCVRSFSTVLRLMEIYPEYTFLQSQPQAYEFIKEDYPDIYEEIKGRVKEGRWETDGAMWVEADCNIPSGESLVRQILIGKNFFRDEFGSDSKFLWLPDVFGYNWALPQILRKSGIETFLTSKISWNQYNKLPHDTFFWRGIDGTEVLTHFITTPDLQCSQGDYYFTYDADITAETINGTYEFYINKEISDTQITSFGHGDGGGGVSREQLEMIRALNKTPLLPETKMQKAGDFFDGLHCAVDSTDEYVHVWDGELYLENHRGTLTSQGKTKWYNRRLEYLYRTAEYFAVLRSLVNNEWETYPYGELLRGWKRILTNQFHDIIPGSSIPEVYADTVVDYQKSWETAQAIIDTSIDAVPQENVYGIHNPSNWMRTDVAAIENDNDGTFKTPEGALLKSTKIGAVHHVLVEEIQGFGAKRIVFHPGSVRENDSGFEINGKAIETPFYSIRFDQHGQIELLYDKEYQRAVSKSGENLNQLLVFEDRPRDSDAWDIDLFYNDQCEEVRDLQSFAVVAQSDLLCMVRLEWKHLHSNVVQHISLYAHTKRIDFATSVDWHENRRMLKAAFPVDVRTTKARFDIQFGNIERPTHWNTSWDLAKFEVAAHKWADISENGFGLALMNDCKYGHDAKGSTLRITLLKSSKFPDPNADMGDHEFTYSIMSHGGDFRTAEVEKQAAWLNDRLLVASGEVEDLRRIVACDNENIYIDAVKRAEHGEKVIVRFHEFFGKTSRVKLTSDFTIASWCETDLMEQPVSPESFSAVDLAVKPYEIKTIALDIHSEAE